MSDQNTQVINDIKLKISVGPSRYSTRLKLLEINWDELREKCRVPVITSETYQEFCTSTKAIQDAIKDVGFYVGGIFKNGSRKKTHMIGRYLVTLDIDYADKNHKDVILKAIGQYAFCVYSTHKHNSDKPRLRLVLPLSRMADINEYEPVARKIAELIGINIFDDTTFQISRVMYWPSRSKDGEFVYYENDGEFVDVDEILGQYNNWQDVSEWAYSDRQKKAPRIAQEKAADPLSKPGLIGAFCRAYSIVDAIGEFIPEAYECTVEGHRFSYTGGTTSNGAVVYDGVFMYSHHESDPISGMLLNAFDLVRIHKFGELDKKASEDTPINKMPSFKAMLKLITNDDEVKKELIKENLKDVDLNSEGKKLPDWILKLEFNEHGGLKSSFVNSNLIIENDPLLKGKLGYNELIEAQVKLGDLPWCECENPNDGDGWQDIDEIRLMDFIGRKYKIEIKSQILFRSVAFVAHQNTFHPVKDYLNGLVWDGVARIKQVFTKYLGVQDNLYTRAVSKKIFCAAVARVFEPGIKFDHLPILEGKQGIGKSTFIKTLADPWFGDNVSSFKGKEAIEAMMGNWVIELSELEVFGKSEIEGIKSFLSRTVDRARMAYGMHSKRFPRRSIFIGTTNDSTYLKDDTGNRRFWPVKCEIESIDIAGLTDERDQIWAEAVALFRDGEPLYLSQEEEAMAAKEQLLRVPDEGWFGAISVWLEELVSIDYYDHKFEAQVRFDDKQKTIKRDRTCAAEIWVECLKGELKDLNASRRKQIARTMRQIGGWERSEGSIRIGNRYGKVHGYVRIKEKK